MTHDIRRIRLALESDGPLMFQAGQFVQLGFADLPFTDYSIANRPGEQDLEFFIQDSRNEGVSHYATRSLSLGEMVDLQGPYGDCSLRVDHEGPVLALAGGSGLAPIKSIIETLLSEDRTDPVHLYFGVRSEQDLFLTAHFQDLAARHAQLHFVPAVERLGRQPTADDAVPRTGLITDLIAQDFESLAGFKAYIAGPPPMVEAATEVLLALGLPSDDLHADAFHSMDLSIQQQGFDPT